MLYDISGRKIQKIFGGELNQGDQSILFDARSLQNGIYFYSLQTGDYRIVKKMILMNWSEYFQLLFDLRAIG